MNDLKLFAKCYVEAHDLTADDKKKLFEYIDSAKDYEVMNLLTTGRVMSLTEDQRDTVVENFKQTIVYPFILLGEQVKTDFYTQVGGQIGHGVKATAQVGGFHVPNIITRFFWNLAKKVTGKHPFASVRGLEQWLSKADANQVASMASKLMTAAGGIGAATLVAIFIFLATKVLRSKLSAAHRACKNLPSDKRKECIKKFKIDAIKNQISVLQKGLTACSKSKDPNKCRQKIQKKIEKLKIKLQKIK